MTKLLTVAFAIIFALNGGLDQVPVDPNIASLLHWVFGGALAGIGVVVGPAVMEAITKKPATP